jgi:hypothetical protein
VVQRRVEATADGPPVIRLRQPIEIAHFYPAGPVRDEVERVLLLGNYLSRRRRMLLSMFASERASRGARSESLERSHWIHGPQFSRRIS